MVRFNGEDWKNGKDLDGRGGLPEGKGRRLDEGIEGRQGVGFVKMKDSWNIGRRAREGRRIICRITNVLIIGVPAGGAMREQQEGAYIGR